MSLVAIKKTNIKDMLLGVLFMTLVSGMYATTYHKSIDDKLTKSSDKHAVLEVGREPAPVPLYSQSQQTHIKYVNPFDHMTKNIVILGIILIIAHVLLYIQRQYKLHA